MATSADQAEKPGRSGWGTPRERFLYIINPFRSCKSYPAILRDNAAWELVFRLFDPARYCYWRLKNITHRKPAIALTGRGREIVEQLRRDGIAVWPGFVAGEQLETLRRTAIEYVRTQAGVDLERLTPDVQLHLNNMGNEIAPTHPIFRFFVSPEIIAIAMSHLGFAPRFCRLGLYLTQPQADFSGDKNVEKHFHRDYNDFIVLKMFVYLSDTNSRNGPFTFVPGSQCFGKRRGLVARLTTFSSSRDVERLVPSHEWREAVGPAGTAIFCETSGIHRGGRTYEGHRLMLVAEYGSHHPWLRRADEIDGFPVAPD